MKLIIHIGTHKTGTTALQRAFSATRDGLLHHGVWYPNYNEILADDSKTSYAHLDLARGIMNEKSIVNKEESTLFLTQLASESKKRKGVNTVLLSGETLLRGKLGSGNHKWRKIQNFQKFIKESLVGFDEIEIVVTLRNYVDYLESLYNEHVKATTFSGAILDFHTQFKERFNYKAIISTWEKNVAPVKVVSFDKLPRDRFVQEWTAYVLGSEVSQIFTETKVESNVSWPLPFVEFKKHINSRSIAASANTVRQLLEQFSQTDEAKMLWPSKYTWLTKSEKHKFVEQYKDDQEWLIQKHGAEFESLSAVNGLSKPVFNGLTEKDWLEFTALNLGLKKHG